MNRSERRLQQLKQTVQLKLSLLDKQKEDIREIIEDYTSHVVTEINNLLSKGQELLQDAGQCQAIIQRLDKASQTLSNVAEQVDSILDAEECGHLFSDNEDGNVFKKDKQDASDNQIPHLILNLSQQSDCQTDRSVMSIRDSEDNYQKEEKQRQSHLKLEHNQEHNKQQEQSEKHHNQEHKREQNEKYHNQDHKREQEQNENNQNQDHKREQKQNENNQNQDHKRNQEHNKEQEKNEKHHNQHNKEQEESENHQNQEHKREQEHKIEHEQGEKHNRQEQCERHCQEEHEKQKQDKIEKHTQDVQTLPEANHSDSSVRQVVPEAFEHNSGQPTPKSGTAVRALPSLTPTLSRSASPASSQSFTSVSASNSVPDTVTYLNPTVLPVTINQLCEPPGSLTGNTWPPYINQLHEPSVSLSGNTWSPYINLAEPHVGLQPLLAPILSVQSQPPIFDRGAYYEDPFRFHNNPQRPYQFSPGSFMSDQCVRIVPFVVDNVNGITSAGTFDIVPTFSQSPEYFVNHHSSYGSLFTKLPVQHQPEVPYQWPGPNQNVSSFVPLIELSAPQYPYKQVNRQNNTMKMSNTILQEQHQNSALIPYSSTLAPAITTLDEHAPIVSDSPKSCPQISRSASTVSNHSVSSDTIPQDLPSQVVSLAQLVCKGNNQNMVCSRSEPSCLSHFEHAEETEPISPVSKQHISASLPENNLQKSSLTMKHFKPAQSSCSQSESTPTLPLPKCLKQSLPIKRNAKGSSGHSRNLKELIKEVEKIAHEKSAKCPAGRNTENVAQEQVIKPNQTSTLLEASEYRFLSNKNSPNTMLDKLEAKGLSNEGSAKNEDRLDMRALTTDKQNLNTWSLQPDKGSVFPAVISSVAHPWSFYVQMSGLIQVISGLIKHAVENEETKAVTPQNGMYCVTKLREQNYCRVKILSVQEQDGQGTSVKVLLIDYGIKKIVPPADLYSIPASLIQHPCQAMFCALHRASPKNADCLWTEGAILEFQQQTKNAEIQVKIIHPSPTDRTQPLFPHIVDIMFTTAQEKGSNNSKSMATHLLEKGFARFMKEEEQIAALNDMYPHSNHNAGDKMKNTEDFFSDIKAQSLVKTPTKHMPSKPKVLHQPLCFKKDKPSNLNTSTRPIATKSSVSTLCTPFVPDVINKKIRTTTQVKASNQLSIKVDEKLHFLGNINKSLQVESFNDHEKHVKNLSSNNSSSSELDAEVEISVLISEVISPSSFFVHHVDPDIVHEFKKLEHMLHSVSTETLSGHASSFSSTRNSLVCAKCSEDGYFYRGLVLEIGHSENEQENSLEVVSSDEKLLIFFIDYGDFEWVPSCEVFPLPNTLKNIRPFVLWCTLESVKPCDAISAKDSNSTGSLVWSDEAVHNFKSLVCGKKMCSAVMSQASFQQINDITSFQFEPVPVFLLDRHINGEEVCVNHELIRLNLASLRSAVSEQDEQTLHSSSGDEWDPMNDDYTSLRNSYKVDIDEAGVALVGHTAGNVGRGGKKVCVHFNKPRGCFRGDRCPNLHVKMDLCGVQCEKVPVRIFEEDQSDLLPQPGSTVTVTVSVVLTPSLFYVTLPYGHLTFEQMQSNPQALKEYLQEETLESMMDNIQKFYNTSSQHNGDLMLLAPGQAMAAKVSGQWVRAKVIDTDVECGLVQVLSVDFGDISWVDERDVRELELQFLHLTPQAVECCLVDLEPQDKNVDWKEETCELFAEMVREKTLVACVKNRYPSGRISITLYDTSDNTATNLNQRLVDCGLAQCSTNAGTPDKLSVGEIQRADDSPLINCLPL